MIPYLTNFSYTLLPQEGVTYSRPSFVRSKWRDARHTLNKLPVELLEEVFKGLNSYDLSLISRVCKNWNYLANQDCFWKISGFTLTQESYASYIKKRYIPTSHEDISDINWIKANCIKHIEKLILTKSSPNEKFLIEFYISKSPQRYPSFEVQESEEEENEVVQDPEDQENEFRLTDIDENYEIRGPEDIHYKRSYLQKMGHQHLECVLKIEGLYRNDESYGKETRYFSQFEPTIIERYFFIDKCSPNVSKLKPLCKDFKNEFCNIVSHGFNLAYLQINNKLNVSNAFLIDKIFKIFKQFTLFELTSDSVYDTHNPGYLRGERIYWGTLTCVGVATIIMYSLILKHGKFNGNHGDKHVSNK